MTADELAKWIGRAAQLARLVSMERRIDSRLHGLAVEVDGISQQAEEMAAQHEAEHSALVSDNTELARCLGLLFDERAPSFMPGFAEGPIRRALDAPHPGAALLSEMEALRKRVDAFEDAKRDAMSDSDSLRRRLSAETARAENAERERDEALAQVATARAAALEEAAQVSDFSADDASGSGFTSDPDDEEGRKMWALVEERHRQDAKAVRALATTPPPPVVPVAKVREVLSMLENAYGESSELDRARALLNLDGEP